MSPLPAGVSGLEIHFQKQLIKGQEKEVHVSNEDSRGTFDLGSSKDQRRFDHKEPRNHNKEVNHLCGRSLRTPRTFVILYEAFILKRDVLLAPV